MGDVFDGGGSRQAGHDDRCVAYELGDVTCDCNLRLCELGAPRWIDIVPDNTPFAINQIACDRAPHDPKPDNSNGLVHIGPLSTR